MSRTMHHLLASRIHRYTGQSNALPAANQSLPSLSLTIYYLAIEERIVNYQISTFVDSRPERSTGTVNMCPARRVAASQPSPTGRERVQLSNAKLYIV